MALIFHRLVQKDLRAVLEYYDEQGGAGLADRFFEELQTLIEAIAREPTKFHPLEHGLRRANMRCFPYHFLFRQGLKGTRVLVLRHPRMHPRFGLGRK